MKNKSFAKLLKIQNVLLFGFLLVALIATILAFNKGFMHRIFASGQTYYVSNSGQDSNGGTFALPFKTLNKAISMAGAGDTVIVASGNYSPVTISKSGSSGLPITIKGSMSKIEGGDIGLNITGSYLNISGFDVSKSKSHVVSISGKHIKFSDFLVHDGVNPQASGVACNNSIQWGSGLKLYVGADDVKISNGKIYQNCGEGFAATRSLNVEVSGVTSFDNFSTNFYIDNSKNVTIKNSFSYYTDNKLFYRDGIPGNGFLIGEEYYSGWGAQLANVSIYNNVSYNARGISIYVPSALGVSGGLVGGLIAHNTIWKIPNSGKAINIPTYPNNANVRIINNIAAGAITAGTGVIATNNNSTAVFASTPSYDPLSFKLGSSDKGINAGIVSDVKNDYLDAQRDLRPDLGAFEYGGVIKSESSAPVTENPVEVSNSNSNSNTEVINVSNDTVPPVITVKSPKNNSIIKDKVYIGARATDTSGVYGIEFLFDGKVVKNCPSQSKCDYTYYTYRVRSGKHEIVIRARDKSARNNQSTVILSVVKN